MRRKDVWLWIVLALGLGLRGYHYVRNPVVWHDEAALLLNVTEKTFAEHLGPLFYAEAAPPFFLWVEKVISLTLGETTFAMRLLPFLGSCLALVFVAFTSRKVFGYWPAILATLLFGFSDRLLWHACEAKPYAIDVFVSAFVITTFAWCRERERNGSRSLLARECFLYAALAPFLLFLSFPACFVLGGVALALLLKGNSEPSLRLPHPTKSALAYLVFVMALGGGFLLLLLGPIHAQRCPYLVDHWSRWLPDWSEPWMVLPTLLLRLTEVARYGCEPVGNLLVPFVVVGAFQLWKTGKRAILGALLFPVGLLACAWLIGKYPIGPSRVVAFAAPNVLMLAGFGLHCVLSWSGRMLSQTREDSRTIRFGLRAWNARAFVGIIATLILIPIGYSSWRVVEPWPREATMNALAALRNNRSAGEKVVGSAWQHTWYLRDLKAEYQPLISEPFSPENPRPLDGDHDQLGQGSWLLMRDTFKHEELVAFARLQKDSRFRLRKVWTGKLVSVYRVERISGGLAQLGREPEGQRVRDRSGASNTARLNHNR